MCEKKDMKLYLHSCCHHLSKERGREGGRERERDRETEIYIEILDSGFCPWPLRLCLLSLRREAVGLPAGFRKEEWWMKASRTLG